MQDPEEAPAHDQTARSRPTDPEAPCSPQQRKPFGPGAVFMDGPGKQFLSGSSFSGYQDIALNHGSLGDLIKACVQLRAAADNPVTPKSNGNLLLVLLRYSSTRLI